MKQKILNISLVIIIIMLLFKNCCTSIKFNKKEEELNLHLQSLTNEVITYKDKNGNLISKVEMFETQHSETFKELVTKNRTIQILQEEVRKYKGVQSSIVFQTNTVFDTTIQTDTMYSRIVDTILQKEEIVYGFDFNDSWVKIKGTVDSKNTELSVEMTNQYGVTIRKKGKKHEALVTNANPYSTVKEMAAYTLSMPKPKKFGIGVSVGYGMNLTTLKPSPYIGVGLSYNLIRF